MSPRGRDDVLIRQLDAEEWVLYDPVHRQMHVLNPTAALVWLHCTGDLSAAGIVAALTEVFGTQVSGEQLARDVSDAVGEFSRLGLLV